METLCNLAGGRSEVLPKCFGEFERIVLSLYLLSYSVFPCFSSGISNILEITSSIEDRKKTFLFCWNHFTTLGSQNFRVTPYVWYIYIYNFFFFFFIRVNIVSTRLSMYTVGILVFLKIYSFIYLFIYYLSIYLFAKDWLLLF